MRRPGSRYVWYLLATTAQLNLCSALTITLKPWETDRPTAQSILFFETSGTFSSGDPELVDLVLRDTRRGNSTTIWRMHNITREPDAGFPLEFPTGAGNVLRMTDSSTQRVIADSEPFEIFPPDTPPSSTYQVQPSGSEPPVHSSAASDEPEEEEEPESKLPLGTIIGGAVGGFAVLTLFFILLYLLLSKRKDKPSPEPINTASRLKRPGDKDVISPFIIPIANGSHPESIPMTTSSGSQSRADFPSAASEKARLKARLAGQPKYYNSSSSSGHDGPSAALEPAGSVSAVSSSDHLLSSSISGPSHKHKRTSSKAAAIRADQLRRERERIDREIAELENASMYSGAARSSSSKPRQNEEVRGQIAALRDQFAGLERNNAGYSPIDEPPPEYVARRTLPPPPQ